MSWTTDLNWLITMLKNGAVAVIPTDTVWGLCCAANQPEAITHFYQLKRREKDKPTALLVGSIEQAEQYGEFNNRAKQLAREYWPGALTLVVPSYNNVPTAIRGSTRTVGIRFPNDQTIMEITRQLGCPLVTGSANFAGDQPPTKKSELDAKLLEQVDVAFDGECGGQPPSTVVDCTGEHFTIIRQGTIVI